MTDKCKTFVARWDHAMCSTCGEEHDRPAPTPTTAPGLDLDAAEKRAAGFRGTFRVMVYDSGEELLEFVSADCDPGDDVSDIDEIAQFACDDETQRAIVATLNEAPALIAEIRLLRAEAARIRKRGSAQIAAEADRDPATRSPLLAAAPNLHPDGCHTADPTAPRDCTSDGHHECTSCARFDAAGRAAMGDDPIGGLCGECGGEGVILGGDDGQGHQEEWPCRSCTRGPLPKGG